MNCRRAKRLVFEFVDGLTDEKVRYELERHLSECSACESLAGQLTRSMDLLHRTPRETLDENFNWKVRLAIHKERSAIQEAGVSAASLFKAWNLRYAASAIGGFVAIAAVGIWAVATSPDRTLVTDNVADNTLPRAEAEKLPPVETSEPSSRDFAQGVQRDTNDPTRVVGTNPTTGTATTPGAIDAADPVYLDSLVKQECQTTAHDVHIDSLKRRIAVLSEHLEKCQGHNH